MGSISRRMNFLNNEAKVSCNFFICCSIHPILGAHAKKFEKKYRATPLLDPDVKFMSGSEKGVAGHGPPLFPIFFLLKSAFVYGQWMVLLTFFHLTNHSVCTASFSSEILTLFLTKTGLKNLVSLY